MEIVKGAALSNTEWLDLIARGLAALGVELEDVQILSTRPSNPERGKVETLKFTGPDGRVKYVDIESERT